MLSSGETPIAVLIGEDQKAKRAHAGQLVRAIDIPAKRALGMFDEAHPDFDAKAFADEMKRRRLEILRDGGPEFVRRTDRARCHQRDGFASWWRSLSRRPSRASQDHRAGGAGGASGSG